MNPSAPFIARPVATTLLTLAILLAGVLGYIKLPVSPLPEVDFPTIQVQASLPGAAPETVATSVAEPLERHLGQIANITEMTSQSSVGSARIVLQFDLSRDINGAARDVEAAINAARADLPTNLRQNPTYRKVNPADAPVLILALTSQTMTRGQMYDAASNVLQQRLSQLNGIGQVVIGGAALPAVRVELNPQQLAQYGIGLEDVRAALASANANSPKGAIQGPTERWQIYTNDQGVKAADYRPLLVAYRNGRAVHLTDVASVVDSVEDLRNAGLYNNDNSVLVILFREPGANIISTVDNVMKALPSLQAALPPAISIHTAADRTTTIRGSLQDTERTLVIAVLLVTAVVFVFLRDLRATMIPAIAVPVSIIGTFGAMYLLGYSLDNLSLMALTIATGFVVDDAIVVLENIARYLEQGVPRLEAAYRGAKEVGFTVVSISLSLIAVFLPILLMGGLVGRLFREFAMTLSLAIVISMVISLTTTPMMCALFLRAGKLAHERKENGLVARMLTFYRDTLNWSLDHSWFVMLILLIAMGMNIWLIGVIPKGFFPQEDTGRMIGRVQADQSTSFQSMDKKLRRLMAITTQDPAIQSVVGFTGGGGSGGPGGATNTATVFVSLKPLTARKVDIDTVINRLRPKLAKVPGAQLFLQAVQDIRAGGRQSNAEYEYTLQGSDTKELYKFIPRFTRALQKNPVMTDVNSDLQQNGLETDLVYDRDMVSRLGLSPYQLDNTLYDAFGQRLVSTIYQNMNQYHVVMEAAPIWDQDASVLPKIWVSTSGGTPSGSQVTNAQSGTVTATATTSTAAGSVTGGTARNVSENSLAASGASSVSSGSPVSTSAETMVPLPAVAAIHLGNTPLAVNHSGQFVSSTISFNLAPGHSLSEATAAIAQTMQDLHAPADIIGVSSGTAKLFEQTLGSEKILVLAALGAVYIVLGILYESTVHPITILSTLPSAGIGAVLALMLFHTEFSIIAMIGMILLIGIVKKNAILMIDFALQAERDGANSRDAIMDACMKRVRPIMMTTLAAMLGALPLALSFGEGGEIRRPLGISIVGGLLLSQALTLYTTPVLYLLLDRFRLRMRKRFQKILPPPQGLAAAGGEH